MDSTLLLKILGVLLIINAIYASFAHKKGKLTIYVDWTDATITALSPLIAFAVTLLGVVFKVPENSASAASVGVFVALVFFGLRVSWNANTSFLNFLSAALAKYTMLILVYGLLYSILSTGARKKHEHHTTAAKRKVAKVAVLTAGYVTWSAWVARTAGFTPILNWFIGDSFKLLPQEGEQPSPTSIESQ